MKRVLIVEDDKAFLNALKMECQLSGFEVLTASDADEAIQSAKTQQPDLIFMDIIIPKRTGLSVIEELRKNEKTSSIPIIAMSSYTGETNKQKVLAQGADLFIEKGSVKISSFIFQAKKLLGL